MKYKHCGGEIKNGVRKCKHCRPWLDTELKSTNEQKSKNVNVNPRLSVIQAQIKELPGTERFWGFRETLELPNILWDGFNDRTNFAHT